jgi:RHS repeat-associated protein
LACYYEDKFRQLGQYEDVKTGLYYNRFRYYDSNIGTYISKDPIGLKGGSRLYEYVNDSNIEIDPFGLITVYRNLRPDEIVSEGLNAKIPGRGMTATGHILNGSKPTFKGSQYISATTDPAVALKWKQEE